MKGFFSIVAFIMAIVAVAVELMAYRAELQLSHLHKKNERLSSRVTLVSERKELVKAGQAASFAKGASSRSHVSYARILKGFGDTTPDPHRKIRYYCEALSAFGKAIKRKPFDAEFLVNWANLRQILGKIVCAQELTKGDFKGAVALALESDPTNIDVLFSSALVYQWSDDRESALDLFKKILFYGTKLGSGQVRHIFEQIASAEDLKKVIPARFPQTADWSRMFFENRPDKFKQFRGTFALLQESALNLSVNEYEKSEIPEKVHFERLLSLVDYSASREISRRLDVELSLFFERKGDFKKAEYFRERASLSSQDVIRGTLAWDSKPMRSSIYGWNGDERIMYDRHPKSVGFFLPYGKSVSLVEITLLKTANTLAAGELSLNSFEVYVSNDNRTWVQLLDDIKFERVVLGKKSLIFTKINVGYHKYWKVRAKGDSGRNIWGNLLDRIITVYG